MLEKQPGRHRMGRGDAAGQDGKGHLHQHCLLGFPSFNKLSFSLFKFALGETKELACMPSCPDTAARPPLLRQRGFMRQRRVRSLGLQAWSVLGKQ